MFGLAGTGFDVVVGAVTLTVAVAVFPEASCPSDSADIPVALKIPEADRDGIAELRLAEPGEGLRAEALGTAVPAVAAPKPLAANAG